jgi:hypothetical protein
MANVCSACEKVTYVSFCHYCRDYKNVIPFEEWNVSFDSEPFTERNILCAIEKAKMTNGWALTDKTEITFDHDSKKVIVWNAQGDYDAHFEESDIEGIQRELEFIENFVYQEAN